MLLRQRVGMNEIGGGRVIVAFQAGETRIKPGTLLTPEFIRALPANNRNLLIDRHYIEVWPKVDGPVSPPAPNSASGPGAERHVVSLGFGNYGVIEGRALHDRPLSREAAYALAGKPDTKQRKRA